jgi:hypothetical protein
MQALYELPDEKVTPEEVMALADSIEADIQGGPAGRPLLAVPHILADDTSFLTLLDLEKSFTLGCACYLQPAGSLHLT